MILHFKLYPCNTIQRIFVNGKIPTCFYRARCSGWQSAFSLCDSQFNQPSLCNLFIAELLQVYIIRYFSNFSYILLNWSITDKNESLTGLLNAPVHCKLSLKILCVSVFNSSVFYLLKFNPFRWSMLFKKLHLT